MMTANKVKEIVASIPDFYSRAVKAKELYGNFFVYCVTDSEFCDRNISYENYMAKEYFCVNVDNQNTVTCNRAFDNYLPLLMVVDDYITVRGENNG